ncbi:H3 lysine-79 specific) [Durusdinium trenchii]|uniref:H3 lysine-79 specific n=1 Tax=Durusdinium trenchii TaxID=1381693 RepID=A0ABP0IGH3_9DINO
MAHNESASNQAYTACSYASVITPSCIPNAPRHCNEKKERSSPVDFHSGSGARLLPLVPVVDARGVAAGLQSMAQDGSGGASTRLERFDGSDPSLYKRWRRRAALMIISLPNTYPAEKYGPKLVEFLSGEAELAVEHIPIEDLAKSGGERLVFKALDERYKPLEKDDMNEALKEFFFETAIRSGETMKAFITRFITVERKLREQGVELPSEVRGWFMLRKLHLDHNQEAMILTATRGSFKVEEVSQAVKAILANSKGNHKPVQKDTFVADEDTSELTSGSWDEDQEVLQVLAAEMQEQEEYDEEAILDTFESYKQVRTKMQEGGNRGSSSSGASQSTSKEVHIVEHDWPEQEDFDVLLNQAADEIELGLDAFMIQGNRERETSPRFVRLDPWSGPVHSVPAEQSSTALSQSTEFVDHVQIHEIFQLEQADHSLRTEYMPAALETHGVPDTACRRSLVGENVLQRVEEYLKGHGRMVQRREATATFRFGNNGSLRAREVAVIPCQISGRHVLIQVAVLPESGAETPLLLSKELLKDLGATLDLVNDTMSFARLGGRPKQVQRPKRKIAMSYTGSPDRLSPDSQQWLNTLNLGHVLPMNQHVDQQYDSEDDSPRHHQIPGDTVMMEGKFKTKPRAPANTFRYIYTCQKNYTGWVRSHIGEGSSAHLRSFKAYVEMRDAKKMTRLNEVAHQSGRNLNFHSSAIVQGARPQGGASAEYTVQQMVVPPLPTRSPPPPAPSQRSAQSWQVVSAAPCSTYALSSTSPKMTAGHMGRRRRMRDDDMEVDANRTKEIQDTWTVWTMELMNKNEEAREHVEKETMWLQNSAGGPQKALEDFDCYASWQKSTQKARIPGMVYGGEESMHVGVNSGYLAGDTSYVRSVQMRQEARKAFIDADSEDRVRRAVERRTRLIPQELIDWSHVVSKKGVATFHDVEDDLPTDVPPSLEYTPTEAPQEEDTEPQMLPESAVPVAAAMTETPSTYGPIRETPLTRAMRQDLNRLDTGRRAERQMNEVLQTEVELGEWTDRTKQWRVSWEEKVLIRLHAHQKGPYRPCEKSCPIPIQWLTGCRHSLIRQDGVDGYMVITDEDYRRRTEHHPELKTWTGYSVFEIDLPNLDMTIPEEEHEVYEVTMREGLQKHKEVELEESKRTEVDKLLKYKALKVIPPHEARLLRQRQGHRILPSRFVITEKPDEKEPGKFKKKSRWCIRGYLDPDLHKIEKQAPTLTNEALSLVLQVWLVVDTCRDNHSIGTWTGNEQPPLRRSRWSSQTDFHILLACDRGRFAKDDQSLADCLIHSLDDPGKDLEDASKEAQSRIENAAEGNGLGEIHVATFRGFFCPNQMQKLYVYL